MKPMKHIIFGGPYSGKTTAHKRGQYKDVESLIAYQPINYIFGTELFKDPKWRALQQEAYRELLRLYIDRGENLVAHYNEDLALYAKSKGYRVSAVILDNDEYIRRRDKNPDDKNRPWFDDRQAVYMKWVQKAKKLPDFIDIIKEIP